MIIRKQQTKEWKEQKKTNGEINLCQCYVNLTVCDFGKLMLHFVFCLCGNRFDYLEPKKNS